MNNQKITILLIEKSTSEASKIKSSLTELMTDPACEIIHYNNSKEARSFLAEEVSNIDVILLDLAMLDADNPKEVFIKVNSAGQETPVIVFTNSEDYNLAKDVIANGAADIITTEVYQYHPETLRNRIIFSIERNNAVNESISYVRKKADMALREVKEEHKQVVNMLTGAYSFEGSSK